MIGTVNRIGFQAAKGYGFIRSGGHDYFLHVNSITDPELVFEEIAGRELEFDVEKADKGPRAVNVRATANQSNVQAGLEAYAAYRAACDAASETEQAKQPQAD